ncbi:MAG: tRNA dihydrouridine synthase DusB [Pseudomonadota bacterium]|nr:tRNA dihydrouridine synthase DusB [Pseudomonadota bacterium]
MQIGPYKLRNQLVLAPMAGVTDRPFRQLCKKFGAALAVSEMVSCNSALWGSQQTQRRMDHEGEVEPRTVQIAGADPVLMAQAARFNVERGAQIIDINMGCPAKKVCNVMAGSALLQHEDLVKQILDAVVTAVEVPVTLKIRTGWDPDHRNAHSIATIAEQAGIQALAIHGRTRACGYKGEAEYETIRSIKQEVSLPVIANGDITSPEKAQEVLELTGADAVMIGRAAQGRPWIFREIEHYMATGELLPEPGIEETRTIMIEHLNNLYSFYGEYTGVRVARKHIAWYSKGHHNGAGFRQRVNCVDTIHEQLRMTHAFFDSLSATQRIAA